MDILALTNDHNEGLMYFKYLKEVANTDSIVHDFGFATYEVGPNFIYLIDIWVLPEFRGQKKGQQLMHEVEEVAKKQGINLMIGSVCINTKNPEANYNMLKHLGFEDSHTEPDMIYLKRNF